MRILTANLREGLADSEALARLLVERDIDIACFQELGPAHVEAIRETLPHGVLKPGWGRTRYYGMGIAAREPLEVDGFPLAGRSGYRTVVGDGFELLNIHMMVYASRSTPHAGILRRRQVRQLLNHVDASPDQRRLLVGDLNSTMLSPAYRSLTARMRDLHVEHARASGGSTSPTWGPWPRGPRWLRLDHALGSGVEIASIEVVRLAGSDHDGLVIEL